MYQPRSADGCSVSQLKGTAEIADSTGVGVEGAHQTGVQAAVSLFGSCWVHCASEGSVYDLWLLWYRGHTTEEEIFNVILELL